MLRGVNTKINFSLNLGRVDLKVAPAKEERIAMWAKLDKAALGTSEPGDPTHHNKHTLGSVS